VEGILNGQIPLIQAYLSNRFGKSAGQLETIMSYGIDETLSLLHEREMQQASLLLSNMVCTSCVHPYAD
jgi:hypothetical protein